MIFLDYNLQDTDPLPEPYLGADVDDDDGYQSSHSQWTPMMMLESPDNDDQLESTTLTHIFVNDQVRRIFI